MKRWIERVMRKIIGEPAWVALKTKIRKVLPARKNSEGGDPLDAFARRIYARMAVLESKANLLLYGAPAKDDFTLRALGTRDLDSDGIAADFFTRYTASIGLAKRQRHQKQIKTLAPKIAKISPRRILDISRNGILDRAFLKKTFPQVEKLEGEIPTDPVTAVQVFAEKKFDLIFCVGTLEALPPREQVQLLIRIVSLLAPNGFLYLHLPYLRNPEVFADAFWGNPDTLRPFSASLLEFLFEDQRLEATRYAWDTRNRPVVRAKIPLTVTEVTYLVRKK